MIKLISGAPAKIEKEPMSCINTPEEGDVVQIIDFPYRFGEVETKYKPYYDLGEVVTKINGKTAYVRAKVDQIGS